MSATSKAFCLLIFSFFFSFKGFAQINQVNSPYSIAGTGDIHPTQFAFNRAMGGVSTALRTPLNINYGNPASYSSLQLTTYEIALQGSALWLNTATEQHRTATGNLSYLAFAFPLKKYWGASFGILPYSYFHYDISVNKSQEGIDTLQYRFLGNGQLYQVYFGNGFKYKSVSAGLNLGYVFGTQSRQLRQTFPSEENVFNNVRTQDIFPRGFIWNLGLQYDLKLSKKLNLIFGASGNAGTKLNSTQNTRWERAQIEDDNVSVIDTLFITNDQKGKISLPAKISTGVSLQSTDQWIVSADVSWENWEQFRFYEQSDTSLTNSLKFSTGATIVPDSRSSGSFFKNSSYSAGGYFGTGRLTMHDTRLTEWGITFGMGMPLKRVRSRLNLSVELGQRGTIQNALIRETSLLATFGFTLNDKWFIKRRYD
ncbi:MAG: outer membrane protein transport protein [Sphingobacteriales bacterium]|nr:MAG: outer membrane protein transport protein [Sphingobacteriales bacterium]